MNRLILIFFLPFFLIPGPLCSQNIHILLVLPDFYGLNTNLYREKFIEYGWKVTVTGMDSVVNPCQGSTGLGSKPMPVDIVIDSIQHLSSYDAVVIGMMNWRTNPNDAYGDLIGSSHFLSLLQEAIPDSVPVMTSCAGTLVLAAAGLLNGVNVQGTPGPGNAFTNQYIAAGANYLGANIPPVVDGFIITTTRGQYYMKQNCDALMMVIARQP